MKQRFFTAIASKLQAIENCLQSGNVDWEQRHRDRLEALIREHAPSGSGFDSGTILHAESTPEKLVFYTLFHHMDEHGCYSGRTEHNVTVRASLVYGITIAVSGRDRNGIKDYIAEQFHYLYSLEVDA